MHSNTQAKVRSDEMVSNNTCPDVHSRLYVLMSDLITVRNFLCPNGAISAVKNSVSTVDCTMDGSVALSPQAGKRKLVHCTH
jgi:hypothetical protein